jgi:hypothetical protein
MTWTSFYLMISMVFNILFIWYIIRMIKRVLAFQERLDEFVESLAAYEGHVDIVYNLETFYGDETLKNLLRHSKAVVDDCREFKALYYGEEYSELDEDEEYEAVDGP